MSANKDEAKKGLQIIPRHAIARQKSWPGVRATELPCPSEGPEAMKQMMSFRMVKM